MDKFDNVAGEMLDEGVFQRVGQKIKNIGRSFKHPISRTFGNDEEQLQASTTTSKGYKKQKMFKDVIKNAVLDLQKLGVLNSEVPTEEMVEYILFTVGKYKDYYNFTDEDLSKLGKQIKY